MEWQVRGARAGVISGTILEGGEFGCAFCKGTGLAPKTKSRCPVCAGQGSVKVPAPAVRCAYCKGRGETPIRSGITCTVCRGRGAVSVLLPIEACHDCGGKGAAGGGNLPCTTCAGKGVVTARR